MRKLCSTTNATKTGSQHFGLHNGGHNGKIILSCFPTGRYTEHAKTVMACVENVLKACNYYNSQVRAFSYYYETTRKIFCAKNFFINKSLIIWENTKMTEYKFKKSVK